MDMDALLGNDVATILRATAASTHQPRGAGSGPCSARPLQWKSYDFADAPPRHSMAPGTMAATARFMPEPEAPAPRAIVYKDARVIDVKDPRRGTGIVVGFPDDNNGFARVMFKLPYKMTVNVMKSNLRAAPARPGC